jgi:two-component system, LytTR family, response regulator LytT
MSAIKVLIVEDESLVAMDMADMLTRIGYEVLPTAYSYDEAVSILQEHSPDIVLADINLNGEKTGLDLGKLIADKYQLPLVFITSHSDKNTVAKAAALKPNGYLVKPFEQEDLFTSIEVALANFTTHHQRIAAHLPDATPLQNTIFVKTDTRFVKVSVADILYLESDGNYIFIVTSAARHIVRSTFREFMLNLPANEFMQVHKSFIVQLSKIDELSHTELTLGKYTIPLSRNFKDELFQKINRLQ